MELDFDGFWNIFGIFFEKLRTRSVEKYVFMGRRILILFFDFSHFCTSPVEEVNVTLRIRATRGRSTERQRDRETETETKRQRQRQRRKQTQGQKQTDEQTQRFWMRG